MMSDPMLNVRETARLLGVHENTIRNWHARGLIYAVRLPGSGYRRFSPDEVRRMRREMMESYAPATSMDDLPELGDTPDG